MVNYLLKIPEEFCTQEIRCGYTVSEKIKKLWAVQIDLLRQLQLVCKKYDLSVYAA